MQTETTGVVIIGAGIAGLAAARTLEGEDFEDYILLEAQDRVGGRIHSVPWNDGWIECGAQWLHGDKSSLAELCQYYELLSDAPSGEGQGSYLRDDGTVIDKRLVREVDDVIRYALEECEAYAIEETCPNQVENIGRVLRSRLRKCLKVKGEPVTIKNMREELFDWNVRFLMIDNSCFTLDELSVKSWGKFKFVGGQEHVIFKAGYSSITRLIKEGLNHKNIRLNSPVETIEWRQRVNRDDVNQANVKQIVVTLTDGRQIFADCVIVTCSLGYLKENHEKMFNPPLPLHLTQGIESLGFGLINKVFLDFGDAWWEPETKGFQLVWSKNSHRIFSREKLATWTRDLTGFDVLEGHRAVLIGWVGGRGAHVLEMLPEQQVASDCVNVLKFFTKNEIIPQPRRCRRSMWKANKYVRGGYSHISMNCDDTGVSPATLAKPVWGTVTANQKDKCVPIIMLAGEATHESYYSTTHGAFETGIKQAETFLRHHCCS